MRPHAMCCAPLPPPATPPQAPTHGERGQARTRPMCFAPPPLPPAPTHGHGRVCVVAHSTCAVPPCPRPCPPRPPKQEKTKILRILRQLYGAQQAMAITSIHGQRGQEARGVHVLCPPPLPLPLPAATPTAPPQAPPTHGQRGQEPRGVHAAARCTAARAARRRQRVQRAKQVGQRGRAHEPPARRAQLPVGFNLGQQGGEGGGREGAQRELAVLACARAGVFKTTFRISSKMLQCLRN